MLLSVVVPVFNTEVFLDKCICSIINQTYENLDIILVDDGSTDGSGCVCDRYAKKDSRIRVLHQDNVGLVSARKNGIKMAKGDVVTFVDSDDWIEKDMYHNMMKSLCDGGVQLVTSGLIIDDETGKCIHKEYDSFLSGTYVEKEEVEKIIECMMWDDEYANRRITSSVCTKIFEKDLLLDVMENIDKNITVGEDAAIVYPYIAMSKKICILNEGWYHYVYRKNSMIHAKNFQTFEKIFRFKCYMQSKFQEIGRLDQLIYQNEQYCRVFLQSTVRQLYDIDMERIPYLFPYDVLPKNRTIVLYGAGKVGKSYWKCLRSGKYANVVSWVDEKSGECIDGRIIEAPEVINNKVFDYIIIAIENEETARDIEVWLTNNSIAKEKIIWTKPRKVV